MLDPNPKNVIAGGDAMSLDLFNLMPAVYRMRDIAIAQSQPLLTPAELVELAALQATDAAALARRSIALDELMAKAQRGPLQSLLLMLQEQLAVLAEDLDQLYDDQFIETCAPWVIPYIGDLIGYQSVKGIAPAVDDPRAEVARDHFACAAARGLCWSWSNWRATSPAGARMRSRSSRCSATRST